MSGVSDFGDAIQRGRWVRGWRQQDLASALGVSQRAVSSWESGISEPPEVMKVAAATALDVSLSRVLRASDALDQAIADACRQRDLADVLEALHTLGLPRTAGCMAALAGGWLQHSVDGEQRRAQQD